jgi:hypothetical protein
MTDEPRPGEGTTAVVSAYLDAAVQRQIERDNLDELIVAAEAEHGPITAEEVEAKRRQLAKLRNEQRGPGAGTAT